MYNHNKAQQSKNRVHISWDILYLNKLDRVIQSRSWIYSDYQQVSSLRVPYIHCRMLIKRQVSQIGEMYLQQKYKKRQLLNESHASG